MVPGMPIPPDTVELLPSTAEALDELVCGHVGRVNVDLQQMSWIARVLRVLEDREEWFPHGKWATIQNIERQLDEAAAARAAEIAEKHA